MNSLTDYRAENMALDADDDCDPYRAWGWIIVALLVAGGAVLALIFAVVRGAL